jgi:hypothetical protein
LLSTSQFPDAVGHGRQHGHAPDGNAHARSHAGQWQQVGEYQHNAEADGTNAEKNGGGGGNAAGRRLQGCRTGV